MGEDENCAYCITGNIIGRQDHNGGNGKGFQKELSYTLTAMDCHAVNAPAVHRCKDGEQGLAGSGTREIEVLNDQGGSSLTVEHSGLAPTLRSQAHGNLPVVAQQVGPVAAVGINGSVTGPLVSSYYKGTGERWGRERDVVLCMASGQSHAEILQDLAPTLNCIYEQPYITRQEKPEGYAGYKVRRLTPLECERLQGFADDWTARGHDGKPISDSKRYQMLGNSIAVPCAAYIMQGICRALGFSGEPSLPAMPGYPEGLRGTGNWTADSPAVHEN